MVTSQRSSSILDELSRTVRTQPGIIILILVAILLVVDLLANFANVEIPLAGGRALGGTLTPGRFASLLWEGVVIGLVFALAGVGLSMTYSILNFANFSHGDLMTTGAFTGWGVALLIAGYGVADAGIGYLLFAFSGSGPGSSAVGASVVSSPVAIVVGVVVSAVVTAGVAVLLDRLVYYPMRDRDGIPLLIASIGVALALRYTIQFMYGSRTRGVTDTTGITTDVIGVEVNLHRWTLIIVSLALMLGLHFMLRRTKLGKAMRAMADNKDLALVTGIPTERVVRWTWLLGAGLAGVSGYLYVLENGTMDFNLGWFLLLFIFAAVILGGIGSIYGAIAGGLVIGIVHEVSIIWVSSDFNAVAAFLIMIVMLLYRPEGLFKGVTTA